MTGRFEAAVADVARRSVSSLDRIARQIEEHLPDEAIMFASGDAETELAAVLSARRADGISSDVAAAYIRGVLAGYRAGRAEETVDVVWSGPSTTWTPVRSTASVLIDLIAEAKRSLLLMTYSARHYPPLHVALSDAIGRGVQVDLVIETLSGAGIALTGAEPAEAFENLPRVRLWHWPSEQRPTRSAKMHAKLVVTDRRAMYSSSVNLTETGMEHSIEAGILVRGGRTPERVVEHIRHLRAAGSPVRLR